MTDQVPDNRPTSEKLAHRTIGGCGIVMAGSIILIIVAFLAFIFFKYTLPDMQKTADEVDKSRPSNSAR